MKKNKTNKGDICCPKCQQKLIKEAYVDIVITCSCGHQLKVRGTQCLVSQQSCL